MKSVRKTRTYYSIMVYILEKLLILFQNTMFLCYIPRSVKNLSDYTNRRYVWTSENIIINKDMLKKNYNYGYKSNRLILDPFLPKKPKISQIT